MNLRIKIKDAINQGDFAALLELFATHSDTQEVEALANQALDLAVKADRENIIRLVLLYASVNLSELHRGLHAIKSTDFYFNYHRYADRIGCNEAKKVFDAFYIKQTDEQLALARSAGNNYDKSQNIPLSLREPSFIANAMYQLAKDFYNQYLQKDIRIAKRAYTVMKDHFTRLDEKTQAAERQFFIKMCAEMATLADLKKMIRVGDFAEVKKLLENNVPINEEKESNDLSALMLACQVNEINFDVIRWLLLYGADISYRYQDRTAFDVLMQSNMEQKEAALALIKPFYENYAEAMYFNAKQFFLRHKNSDEQATKKSLQVMNFYVAKLNPNIITNEWMFLAQIYNHYSPSCFVPRDTGLAFIYTKWAAENGSSSSMVILADALLKGVGTARSLGLAYEWLTKAYNNGYRSDSLLAGIKTIAELSEPTIDFLAKDLFFYRDKALVLLIEIYCQGSFPKIGINLQLAQECFNKLILKPTEWQIFFNTLSELKDLPDQDYVRALATYRFARYVLSGISDDKTKAMAKFFLATFKVAENLARAAKAPDKLGKTAGECGIALLDQSLEFKESPKQDAVACLIKGYELCQGQTNDEFHQLEALANLPESKDQDGVNIRPQVLAGVVSGYLMPNVCPGYNYKLAKKYYDQLEEKPAHLADTMDTIELFTANKEQNVVKAIQALISMKKPLAEKIALDSGITLYHLFIQIKQNNAVKNAALQSWAEGIAYFFGVAGKEKSMPRAIMNFKESSAECAEGNLWYALGLIEVNKNNILSVLNSIVGLFDKAHEQSEASPEIRRICINYLLSLQQSYPNAEIARALAKCYEREAKAINEALLIAAKEQYERILANNNEEKVAAVNPDRISHINVCYQLGVLVLKNNPVKAAEYFSIADHEGDYRATFELAELCCSGCLPKIDYPKAQALYEKIIDQADDNLHRELIEQAIGGLECLVANDFNGGIIPLAAAKLKFQPVQVSPFAAGGVTQFAPVRKPAVSVAQTVMNALKI